MALMPQLGSRWPEWAGWVSFKLSFARAALEQGFTPTSPSVRHGNGDTLVYGCNYSHPDSGEKCSFRFKLVWDEAAGEDVVVEHVGTDLPVINSSFPNVDTFRAAITAFAAEQGFKAWVAGGAHGAPRCRMICSRSRKATPGEAKCGFSISVRQNVPAGNEWIVEELEPRHTHRLFGKGEGSVEADSPAPPSRVRKATSEAGSVKRRRDSSKPPLPPPQPRQRVQAKAESEAGDVEEIDPESYEREDDDGTLWTARKFSTRDTEKIARLVRKPPLTPVASFNTEASFSVLAIRIGASAIAEGFHVIPMLCDDKDHRQLQCSRRGCPWILTARKKQTLWRRDGPLAQHTHPTHLSSGASPASSSRATGRDDEDDGGEGEDDGEERGGKRARRDSNATTATGAETDDSRSASGAPRGIGGGGGGPAPTSRATADPVVKLEAVDDPPPEGFLSRLRGHLRGFEDHTSPAAERPHAHQQGAAVVW
ncbi:hypothetical protein RQP46_005055 [Phenoliferia psychrophenolica]